MLVLEINRASMSEGQIEDFFCHFYLLCAKSSDVISQNVAVNLNYVVRMLLTVFVLIEERVDDIEITPCWSS